MNGIDHDSLPAEQIQSIEKALLGMVRHIGLEGNTDEGFFGYGRAACLAWGDPPDEVNVEFVDGAFGDLRQTWYEQFFASDPRPELRRLRVPLVALFAGDAQAAIRVVNAEQKNPTACAIMNIAFMRGNQLGTDRHGDNAFQITHILVIGIENGNGIQPVPPAAYYSAFGVKEYAI